MNSCAKNGTFVRPVTIISLSNLTIREKAFREMKKDVGMTTAQKSKETRVGMKDGRMEMGSVFVLHIQPTILHIRTI